jgi:hypothetical protein
MGKNILIIIGILVFCTGAVAGDDTLIRVKAIGLASPKLSPGPGTRAAALRAAKVEGYKKLAEAAGYSTILPGKYKHTRVEACLTGARVIQKRYISDYKVEVVMEIEKKNIRQTKISLLKREIKTIQTKISTLSRRLEKLKKMQEALEEKIKKEGN